jgi:LysM domain
MAALAYAPRIGPNGRARRNRSTHVGDLGVSTTLRLVAIPAPGERGGANPPVAFRPVIVEPVCSPRPEEESPDATITPLRPSGASREFERRLAKHRASERRARVIEVRRRRVRALGMAITSVAVAGALWFGSSAMASSQDHLQVLPGSVKTAHGYLYRVQPGDTVWSIATRLDPTGDPRPIADQIESEIGGTNLQVGTQVLVP